MAAMAERDIPTEPQARLLAKLWGDNGSIPIGGYNSPTSLALLKRGWIAPNGIRGKYPNGTGYEEHVVSDAGLAALGRFLAKREG
jgi:hypothetical protein